MKTSEPEIIKKVRALFKLAWNLSCSYMLKCQKLKNIGIKTCISRINTYLIVWKQETFLFSSILAFMTRWNFMLSSVGNENSFITSEPEQSLW